MDFKLISDFQPTGDQPEAIKQLAEGLEKGVPFQTQFSSRVDSFFPRIHHERFSQIYNAPRGAGIFVCDRSDWAASYWPRWCQEQILKVAWDRPDIRLYLLTKQPQELKKWSPFPDNVWVGVSACNEIMYLKAGLGLRDVKAKVKFLSCEPLLEEFHKSKEFEFLQWAGINWLIIGAQTKPYRPPEIAAVRNIVDDAGDARIPVFIKNNIKPLLDKTHTFGPQYAYDVTNFKITGLRQEMPIERYEILATITALS